MSIGKKMPCPFCGSTDGASLYDMGDYISVCCLKCDAVLGDIAGPGRRSSRGSLYYALKARQDAKDRELDAFLRGEAE